MKPLVVLPSHLTYPKHLVCETPEFMPQWCMLEGVGALACKTTKVEHAFCGESALQAGGTSAGFLCTDTRDRDESIGLEITPIHGVLPKLWPYMPQKGVVPPLACLQENGGDLPLLSHLACGAKAMLVEL